MFGPTVNGVGRLRTIGAHDTRGRRCAPDGDAFKRDAGQHVIRAQRGILPEDAQAKWLMPVGRTGA